MKKILHIAGLAIGMLCAGTVGAQQYFTTVATTGGNTIPTNSATTNRAQWLYLTSDLNAAPPAGVITKVYIKNSAAVTNPTFTNLTVRLGMTNATTLVTGPWLQTVQAFTAPTYSFPGTIPASAMIAIPLQAPFYYDGVSNLLLEVSQTGYTAPLAMAATSVPARRLTGGLNAATGSVGNSLAGFGFDMVPAVINNTSAFDITEPVNFCAGTHPVRLKVRNNGANIINGMTVNWTLDGVAQPPVSYAGPALQSVANAPGNQAIVTLGNVTFNSHTARVIKAWTSQPNGGPDAYAADDTVTVSIHAALDGIYTVGGANPDYATIDDAADDLNAYGVCGPVTMNIRSGSYANQRALLQSITGASATNYITFKSEANNAASVIITNANTGAPDNYIFSLNNTQYITIRDLTLRTTHMTFGRGVVFAATSSYDSVVNCVFNMATGTTNTLERASIATNSLTGSNNVIMGNTITGGGYGIYWQSGSAIVLGSNNRFLNNNISGAALQGIYCFHQSNAVIAGNTITAASPTGTYYGINMNFNDDGCIAAGNKVTVTGGGIVNGILREGSDGTAAQRGKIYNNVVSITSTGATMGLCVRGSSYQDVYNNTVWVSGTNGAVVAAELNGTGAATGNNTASNNIFYLSGTTGNALRNVNPAFFASDYNNVFGGTNLFTRTTPALTTSSLSAWRLATGTELNSICYRPGLTSVANPVPNPADTAVWSIHGRGIHIAGNSTDFGGAARPTSLPAGVPDLGAYEFVPASTPPASVAAPAAAAPGLTQTFTFGQDTVAVLAWGAASSVPTALAVRPYSGIVPTALPAGSFMYFYTDVAAAGPGLNYNATIYYKDPWKGTSPPLETALRAASREGANPWVYYPGAASSVEVNRNMLSVPAMTTGNWYTGRVDSCGGTPLPLTITTPPMTTTICGSSSTTLNADDPNLSVGISYHWQSALSPTGPWTTISGANTLSLATGPLNGTTYFRVVDSCGPSGLAAVSNVYALLINDPQVMASVPASRCGPGTLTLSATPSANATIKWYSSATGGTPLLTGNTYTTPVLAATTTYYIDATEGQCVTSPRVVVTATVTPGGLLTVSADTPIVCNNAIVALTVTSPLANFDTYTWSPAANLYQDAAATIPYFGGNATTVYARTTVPGYAYYVALGVSNANQCTGMDTAAMFTQPTITSITGNPDTVCFSGIAQMTLVPIAPYGAGTIRWLSSGDNGLSYDPINGAVNSTYLAPTLLDTGFFRVQIRNGAGALCQQFNKTIIVKVPTITDTISAARCGAGTVVLSATTMAGYNINWYTAASGGQPVFTGPNFTTPLLTATTTYYVSAGSGNCDGARLPVTATVTPAPVVTVSPQDDTLCYSSLTGFTAVSANPGYRYQWNPMQLPGATLSIPAQVSTSYFLYAIDTSGNPQTQQCAWYDTVSLVVLTNPVADATPLSPTTFCAGDSVRIKTPYMATYTYQWRRDGIDIPGGIDTVIAVTASGSYTVRVVENGRCATLSAPELVTVNPLPNPVIAINNGILYTGSSYVAYQWLRNGQVILGATGQQFVPTQNGDYTVAVTDANGCSNTSSIWRVSNTSVAMVNGLGGTVSVAPNPTSGMLTITSPVPVNAVVTTMDGRLVLRQADAKKLDLGALADGVYFLRILDAADGALLKSEKILKAQ